MSDTKPTAWGIEISGELSDIQLHRQLIESEFHRRQEKYPDATRKFVELYTADQLRAAKVAVLRELAAKWSVIGKISTGYEAVVRASEIDRMADEIEKGE